jgi:hypothetical protein
MVETFKCSCCENESLSILKVELKIGKSEKKTVCGNCAKKELDKFFNESNEMQKISNEIIFEIDKHEEVTEQHYKKIETLVKKLSGLSGPNEQPIDIES